MVKFNTYYLIRFVGILQPAQRSHGRTLMEELVGSRLDQLKNTMLLAEVASAALTAVTVGCLIVNSLCSEHKNFIENCLK